MAPQVDLVLIFRSSPGKVLSKPQARENARQATQQYTRLLEVLKNGRLHVVGKRGEKEGQLLVLVQCPQSTLTRLVQRERYVIRSSGRALDLVRPHLTPSRTRKGLTWGRAQRVKVCETLAVKLRSIDRSYSVVFERG